MLKRGWHGAMSATTYHSDPCEVPSLSNSIANVLLTRSPLHAWRAHPKLGGKARESSEEQDKGSVVHALILGEDERIVVIPFDDFRMKAARDMRDHAIANGLIPVKASLYRECLQEVKEIKVNLAKHGIVWGAGRGERPEMVAIWDEPTELPNLETGIREDAKVLCRARMDCVHENVIYDIKTTRDGTDAAIERAIRTYGYHVQQAAYISAFERLTPSWAGRVEFLFLFIELETLEVIPVELGSELRTIGEQRWQRAVNAWGKCLRANEWPGYAPMGKRIIECSQWAMTNDQNEAAELRERMASL